MSFQLPKMDTYYFYVHQTQTRTPCSHYYEFPNTRPVTHVFFFFFFTKTQRHFVICQSLILFLSTFFSCLWNISVFRFTLFKERQHPVLIYSHYSWCRGTEWQLSRMCRIPARKENINELKQIHIVYLSDNLNAAL